MSIWLVRIEGFRAVSTNGGKLLREYLFSFRVSGTQEEAENKADEILNTWLFVNPGEAATWSISAWVSLIKD